MRRRRRRRSKLAARRVRDLDEPSRTLMVPSRADRNIAVGALQRDRAAVADDLEAVAGHELAGWPDLQRAVAGVALAARRVARPGSPCRRSRRRAGCRCARSGPGVMSCQVPRSCTKLTLRSASDRASACAVGDRIFLEDRAVGLEAGGVHVGDVVRDDVELAAERDLSRQTDQQRIVHLCSPSAMRPPSQADPLSRRRGSPKPSAHQCFAGAVPEPKSRISSMRYGLFSAACGAGKNRRLAGQPGKTFRAGRPRQASINHTNLPSLAKGRRGRVRGLFRFPPLCRLRHSGSGQRHGSSEGQTSESRDDKEPDGRRRRSRQPKPRSKFSLQAVRRKMHDHRRRRRCWSSVAAASAPGLFFGPCGEQARRCRGQARDLRRSAGGAGQSVERRQRPHAISQGQGDAGSSGQGAGRRRSSR